MRKKSTQFTDDDDEKVSKHFMVEKFLLNNLN